MAWAWKALEATHANSFAVPVYWNVVEPVEGQFDFSAIDSIIDGARERNLRVAILWFASWKNGKSRYTPKWVKRDPQRFQRTVRPDGEEIMVLSPHCQASMEADRKAFCAFMAWLKAKDEAEGTVFTVQIENEPGMLSSDRDYSPLGEAAYQAPVPQSLIAAMQAAPDSNVTAVWQAQGSPTGANWETTFGWYGGEFSTAWAFSHYIDAIAKAGKAIYDIPLYVNVWLGEGMLKTAGTYPSGGAVLRALLLDLWKWSTPHIDLIAPDIYLPDTASYTAMCAGYGRADNPLYIPESSRSGSNAWHMFAAVGDYDCIGMHVFGIEDVVDEQGAVRDEYRECVERVCVACARSRRSC